MPLLDPFFLGDGFTDVLVRLVPDESVKLVRARESFDEVVPVLPRSAHQVIGDSNVQRAVGLVGEEVFVGEMTRELGPGLRRGDIKRPGVTQ